MIGGPNDVLVKSQINRAVVPARDNAQTSPLLVPSAPVRQPPLPAPAPAAVEAPAKIAARAPVADSAVGACPARAARTGGARADSGGRSVGSARRAAVDPKGARSRRSACAGSCPGVGSYSSQTDRARTGAPDFLAAAAAQMAETARPAPASPPPARQGEPRPAQPRPTQPRATMPPPIIPANAAASRATPVRASGNKPREKSGQSLSHVGFTRDPRRRGVLRNRSLRSRNRSRPIAVSKAEPVPATVKTEPPAGPTVSTVPRANSALAQTGPAPKTPTPGARVQPDSKIRRGPAVLG